MGVTKIILDPTPRHTDTFPAFKQSVSVWTRQAEQAIRSLGTALNNLPTGSIGEAPSDGKFYGRKNKNWSALASGDIITALGYTPLADAPQDGVIYGRQNGLWVPVVVPQQAVPVSQTLLLVNCVEMSRQFLNALNTLPSPWFQEVIVPFKSDGTTAVTFNVTRIWFRAVLDPATPPGTIQNPLQVQIQKSIGAGVFSATNVGSILSISNISSMEAVQSASLGTVTSGDKLRVNVVNLGSDNSNAVWSSFWTVGVEIYPH